MRLSFVLELLLVFLFLAFAAARVIDKNDARSSRAKKPSKRQGPPNRYCACTANMCNCCRDFSLPVVPLRGPGCASLQYLKDDNMLVTMSFGERVLANTTVSGRKPKPICMSLPGGISQFCGRVYGISRSGEQFKACLGLELRALDDIEAALRVSCFKFGPKGVNLEAAPPIPDDDEKKEEEDDDDYGLDDDDDDSDEDDDGFGLGDDGDDYDDDEDSDAPVANQDNEVDGDGDDDADYTGFSLGEDLLSGLFGDDDEGNKKKKKKIKTAKPDVTTKKPLVFPHRPTLRPQKKPQVTLRPNRITLKPTKDQQSKPSGPVPVVVLAPAVNATTTSASPVAIASTVSPAQKAEITATASSSAAPTSPPVTKAAATVKLTTTTSVPTTVTTTTNGAANPIDKNSATDLSIPQIDVAKVEALAAIAQQAAAAPMLVSTTSTSKPITTPQPAVSEMLKNANAVPVENEDEDDLLDGMLGEIASIVSDDDKPKPVKTETDKTKKGDLPSSSVSAKPVKKPVDDEDPISFLTSVVGDDDDTEEYDDDDDEDDEDDDENDSSESNTVDKPTKDTSNETENDDPLNMFDSVIGLVSGTSGKKKDKPTNDTSDESSQEKDDESDESDEADKESDESEEGDDDDDVSDDILGALDDNDDEKDDSSPEVAIQSSTQIPNAKPEANFVDSNEVATIEDVTDYESEEEKVTTSTQPPEIEVSSEASKTDHADEKSTVVGQKPDSVEENEEHDESTDLEIEGDIGLGADDEERQIRRIQQIVGETKRGSSPANWSIFLRPARRYLTGPPVGSARGDRSSRVHRRMNLERVP